MIVYKIDSQKQVDAGAEIRDMAAVLAEIPQTLEILNKYLTHQGSAISTPSIDNYRYSLNKMVTEAAETTKVIAENAQRLVAVSEQASKHLAAVEDHFSAVLRTPQNQHATSELVQA
jgi:hypothetical protein